MKGKYFSVEEIAKALEHHPKTIQRYIREGRIKAVKVGKSWRVSEMDFRAFMNAADVVVTHPDQSRQVTVSSVVDIPIVDAEDGIRIANMLAASLEGARMRHGHSSLNIQFIEIENKIRIMLWGSVGFMEDMMQLIGHLIDSQ